MIKILNVLIVIILIIIAFYTSFLDLKISIKRKNKILFLFVITISLFLSFRDIGLDLEVYREIFNNQSIISIKNLFSKRVLSSSLEPFFVVLISTLKKYGFGFNWFLLISGGIPMYIIYSVIRKNEQKHMLTTFLFFLLMQFFMGPVNIIKHFFAASLYLSALYSLSQKSELKFWMKSIFSVFFHYSNISILFFRFILTLSWNKTKYIASIIIVCVFAVLSKFFIEGFTLLNFNSYGNYIIWKFIYYLTYYDIKGYRYISILHKVLLSIINYFPFILNIVINFMVLNKIKTVEKDEFSNLLLNSQIIGSLIGIFFIILNAETLGFRLNFLFSIGNFFLIKEVIFNYYKYQKKILFPLFIIILLFYNFFVVLYYAGVQDPMSPFFLF